MAENTVNEGKGAAAKKWLVFGIGLLLLITVIAVFSLNKGDAREGTLVVEAGDTLLGSFTVADIKTFPAVHKELVLQTNCGDIVEHNYTCVPLLDLLNSIDPGLRQNYDKVITRGIDYYSQVLEMSEVLQPDNVYIAYADFGQPLEMKSGAPGTLQLIVCSDKSGQRFTNWLVSLELQ